jgi:hypothetical protein
VITVAVRRALPAAIAAAAVALLIVAVPAARSASYTTCRLTASEQQPTSGKPTYNLKLQERGTSCGTARKVMRAFHGCRSKAALNCSRRVLGRWTCRTHRDSSTPITFYATYTCTAGRAAVKGTYQQNT